MQSSVADFAAGYRLPVLQRRQVVKLEAALNKGPASVSALKAIVIQPADLRRAHFNVSYQAVHRDFGSGANPQG